MNLFKGIAYNLKGVKLGLKTPRLFLLGLTRFVIVVFITILSASLILLFHQEILNLVWAKPESQWIVWLWHAVSWLLSILLVGVAAIISYLISQILFSVIIMDKMSRITEQLVSGREKDPRKMPFLKLFLYLIRQEIPRATIPVLLTLIIMILGWLTPLGPVVAIITSAIAAILLSWDNTDLVPARRLEPFKSRFNFLLKNLLFHLGFGILFLIPGLNILFLSFAPIGATLYYIDKESN
ncbi:MAG: EI24 domain-containing protein [Deltaproteobacteria bacterium]|nr:MAG: EI24 domain-containing protein [Deltaproteobacteria bacterium]